jgi:hypothetical protein
MAMESRRAALCAQSPRVVTGIDFVQVVDATLQDQLHVFFVIEPDDMTPDLCTPAMIGTPATNLTVTIEAVHGGAAITIVDMFWRQVTLGSVTRICLEINVAEPGGFEPCRLSLGDVGGQIDPFLGTVIFDFKQACPTGFDCEADHECVPEAGVDFPVDYLARDFESYRRALLDFAAQRYPEWREPIEADLGAMLMEIMAALGDEFAYIQDRNDAESRFATATQRASLAAFARLVDYSVDHGQAAHGEVVLTAIAGGEVPEDAVLWAAGAGQTLVPFSTDAAVWVHPAWNAVAVHNPDLEDLCIAKGQTSILMAPGTLPAGATPPDPDVPGNDLPVDEFLVGRRAMLVSDPADPSLGRRAWAVTITAAVAFSDPLLLTGGLPTPVIRIDWTPAEATPFDLVLDGLTVALNLAPVTAGQPVIEYARAGDDSDVEAIHGALPPLVKAKLLSVPRLIEREGPFGPEDAPRAIVARHGLVATEASSLRFGSDGQPRVTVTQLADPLGFPVPLPTNPMEVLALFPDDTGAPDWTYFDDLLDSDLDTAGFTVEPGIWRTVLTHQLPFGDFAFRDYAADSGWSVKFGFGEFGEAPADGALLRIRYHTDPGLAGNIASFTTALSFALGAPADPAFAGIVSAATNPLAFANARVEESPSQIRLNAPQAYRALPRRAVRPEDYSRIIERMLWVQKAHSTTRWTGSWSTDFVAVDPLDSVAISDAQRAELGQEIDCIRLAARDARPVDPTYRDIDLHVRICIAAHFYAGDVLERVRDVLAPPGFFAPSNFTFGDSLRRSAIEAAVQDVPGVAHVDGIAIRVHGIGDWREFGEAELAADAGEIIRLQNDFNRSTLGLLRVSAVGAM